MSTSANRTNQAGFTLIEMLVVLGIIMGLVTVVSVNVVRQRADARVKEAHIQISNLKTAIQTYYVEQGRYPTQAQGLAALVNRPTAAPLPVRYPEGGYLDSLVLPDDPWNNAFIYLAPGRHGEPFEILSYGEDGEPGGTDRAAEISSSLPDAG